VLSWTLLFLGGILVMQQFHALPSVYWVSIALVFSIATQLFFLKYKIKTKLLCAFVAGFLWAFFTAYMQLSSRLPVELEGKIIPVTGYIASIPNAGQFGTSFLFSLQKLNNHSASGSIKITWNNKDVHLFVGDQWQLNVRLKKPYGSMNQGGFDYEAFAFQAHILANGAVVTKLAPVLVSSHWYHYSIDRIRQYLHEKILQNLPHSSTSQWISALAIGERNDIESTDWQVLRNTGTNHLMAIAGLHIGFMALLAHVMSAFMWRCFPRLTLKIPAVHVGAMASLVMAMTYSAMAGFSIPTQRACLMLFVFIFALLRRRQLAAWHAWSGALLCVLIVNPLSVLTESFWLSFSSVALIIYGVSGRLSPTGLWWKWGRIQWVIALGLVPFSIWLFQQCSLISFIANSIAIPWVGFIVVPLCFIGTFTLLFSAKIGGLILILADKILSVLWVILAWLAHLPGVVWYHYIPAHWMIVAGIGGVILLLVPIGFPGRYLGVIWLLPLMLYKAPTPKSGEMWFTLLDVGQGLSAVVQTQKHVLLFDAGARFGTSFDMGDSVVVPFLHSMGVNEIDMMVISHGDNDHIGGATAVLKQLRVSSIKTSVPEKFTNATYCLAGTEWNWDGVNFAFLYPTKEDLGLNNDSSCVLRITSGVEQVLLAGDIEEYAEEMLLANQSVKLQSTVLIAPHHGSKTSGLKAFIQAVHPQYVLYPFGYRNRYHFPHSSVVKTYQELQVVQYDTVKSGAIRFMFNPSKKIEAPNLYRVEHGYYWNN
jgi:competence protein ComEC